MKTSEYSGICAILLCLLLLTCNKSPDYPTDDLLTAPESIEIDGRDFVMETVFHRIFGSSGPPDGYPMFGLIWIIATDSLPFPSSLDADFLWVINDMHDVWVTDLDLWITELDDDFKMIEDNKLNILITDGPKWDTTTSPMLVDVIVRLVDSADNKYLLRAADQAVTVTR